MKKSFVLTTLLGLFAITAPSIHATHLTAEQALARLTKSNTPSRALSEYSLTETVGNLYIFSGEEGYIVLPSDDAAPALLGYSERSKFDAGSNPNLAYWLENLNAQIEYMAENPQATSTTANARSGRERIAPMIMTRWNQMEPYNNDCPTIDGRRCVTGCVATAMAQVINYHKYPQKGTGTKTYDWRGQELSFDYGNTTFDWDAMADRYDSSSSDESKAAVAQLMYACGVSVKMNYGIGDSGASSANVAGALMGYFNYDRAMWLARRDAYGIDEWEELIYNELKAKRPVIYSGQGSGGGHEFVCDGYSDHGYFHFNWGWGGMSDGYFLLTALNPTSLGTGGGAGGFNFDQDALIGVQPAREGAEPTYVMYNFDRDFDAAVRTADLGDDIEFTGSFINYGAETIDNFYVGVKLQRVDGSETRYLSTDYKFGHLSPEFYFESFHVIFPADLAAGEYIVTPAYRVEGREWQDIRSFLSVNGSLYAKVKGNNVTFSMPELATIKVTDVDVMSDIYVGHITALSYIISNPGDTEYIGEVTPCMLDDEGKIIAKADPVPVDLLGGTAQDYKEIVTSFKAEKDAEYKAGTFRLVFRDSRGSDISDPIEIIVKDAPEGETKIKVTDFRLVSENPVTDKNSVEFRVTVECESGYFSRDLRVIIFPYEYGDVESVASKDTPYFYLAEGQSETKAFSLDLSSLDNRKYFAMIYVSDHAVSDTEVIFELKDDKNSGIGEIYENGNGTDSEEIIYDLNGISHTRPLTRGIYIINGVKTLVR